MHNKALTRSLRRVVLNTIDRYESGTISVDLLATRITHLNFHDDFTDDARDADPELACIIEELAPDLEVDPTYVDNLDRIVKYASDYRNRDNYIN